MTADDLLGRRYSFAGNTGPDVTVVAVDPQAGTVRLHAADGGRQTLVLAEIVDAIERGALQEAAAAPFVHPERFEFAAAERLWTMRRNGRTVSVTSDELFGRRS